ncbi:hypothetical protein WMF18_04100 [Sorangium sp. So ce315]|uniref:hypothetical protein n=1 Tax=Sorangium sp. So ce315 TaxID=3133299 RepID=UPI003F63A7DF
MTPQQGSLRRESVDMVARELQLDHHLVAGPRLRPRRGQMREPIRAADHEEAIALDLLKPDLGWVLPSGRAAGDARGLLRERAFGELVRLTHDVAR